MRGWGVDDWFRPTRWRSAPLRRRELTVRDRWWAVAFLALLVLLALVGPALLPQLRALFLLYLASLGSVQLVVLYRTRHLGWRPGRGSGTSG